MIVSTDNQDGKKVCAKCGEEKLLKDFHPIKQSSDGRRSQCRECVNKVRRVWWKSKPEEKRKNREYGCLYRKRNYQKCLEHGRKWREKNPEKCLESGRKWRKNNIEKKRKENRKWAKNNPEKILETNNHWRLSNPDRVKRKR